MQTTYANVEMLIEESRATDRAPRMPLLGFIIGTGVSLVLWSVIGWSAWLLLS